VVFQSKGQGFYVGAHGGYSLSFLKQVVTLNRKSTGNSNMSGSTYVDEAEKVYANYGSGANAGILAGYGFTSNIAVEVSFNQFFTSSFASNSTSTNSNNGNLSSSSISDLTFNSTLSCFSGGVKYSIPLAQGNVYSKAGVLMGLSTITTKVLRNNTSGNQTNSSERVEELTGNISLGAYTALGFEKLISPKVSLFGEVALNLLQFNPTKSEVTKYTQNGIDQLPNLSVSEKETVYEESYTNTSVNGTNQDPKSPDKSVIQGMNFSSVGVRGGVIFKI
jgi:hypothetical protein